MENLQKPPKAFWIISIIALLWNILGLFQLSLSTIFKEQLYTSLTPEQIDVFKSLPSWHSVVFTIAVFSGLLGCIALLLRKKIAIPLFIVSLITILIQMGYWLFGTRVIEVYGTADAVTMPIIVIMMGILLYFYSKQAANKQWIQ